MADGEGVPGVRMVADGAWVRVDIATNKEQCQDKETPKGGPVNKKKRSRPVVTGQRAAQRKNSPRQWGRPFGLSCHFDPSPFGRGLHHHVEVAGCWCSLKEVARGLAIVTNLSGKIQHYLRYLTYGPPILLESVTIERLEIFSSR